MWSDERATMSIMHSVSGCPKTTRFSNFSSEWWRSRSFFLVDKNGTDTIAAAILGGRLFLVLMADVVRRTGHNVNHAFGIRLPKDRQILKLLKWMMKGEPKFFLVDKKRHRYYCGRHLGRAAIPGSDGRCGPTNGPQCQSCIRYQVAQRPPDSQTSQVNDEGAEVFSW